MKKSVIKYYFLLAVLVVTGCKKSLLDLNPQDRLSLNSYWGSPADADFALNGCYNTLYASGNSYSISMLESQAWDCFTDNAYSQNNSGGCLTITAGGLTPNTGAFQSSYYNNSYSAIGRINNFLANVGRVAPADQLGNYRGQALFLRAFYYFWLTQLYGGVPLTTDDPFTVKYTQKKAAATPAAILTQINSDLDSAISYLPDNPYTDGHIVKGTAQAYKVRVLMYQQKYQDANAMAQQIISGKKFSLNPSYEENFRKPGQNSSKEIMFSVKFQQPNIVHQDGVSITLSMAGWGNFSGTQNMIDFYQCTDGKDTATSAVYVKGQPYANRDPRMRMTFFFPGDGPANGWPFVTAVAPVGTPGLGGWLKGFYLGKKGIDPSIKDPSYSSLDDQDYVQMRYADVLLLNAEALNELGRPADAAPFVNQIRERVNMPDLPVGLSQSQMRDAIRYERRVEFTLEGIRYFDLRRWGIAKQVLDGFVPNPLAPTIKTKYPDNYALWPIPQTEIDFNKPELNQNPGY
ncbi:MAG: RagB/SusD family nutrient uptake outer membrane protein [Niabella sp.]|nr:RagB/SusD family nutrient uptake outer membrane protein [Niabella sp.]